MWCCFSNECAINSIFVYSNSPIDPFEGGEVTVGDFIAKAKDVCATANVDQPFMCLDVTYISILLKDGFGLDSKTKIKVRFHFFVNFMKILKLIHPFHFQQLYKKIDDHEISWALGCAYNLLADVSRSRK